MREKRNYFWVAPNAITGEGCYIAATKAQQKSEEFAKFAQKWQNKPNAEFNKVSAKHARRFEKQHEIKKFEDVFVGPETVNFENI